MRSVGFVRARRCLSFGASVRGSCSRAGACFVGFYFFLRVVVVAAGWGKVEFGSPLALRAVSGFRPSCRAPAAGRAPAARFVPCGARYLLRAAPLSAPPGAFSADSGRAPPYPGTPVYQRPWGRGPPLSPARALVFRPPRGAGPGPARP